MTTVYVKPNSAENARDFFKNPSDINPFGRQAEHIPVEGFRFIAAKILDIDDPDSIKFELIAEEKENE